MQGQVQDIKVIVDTRERNQEIMGQLAQLTKGISFATLPVGDYIVSDRICIERKTERDFESSIINARIFDQLERLKESFEKPILIMEASEDGLQLGHNVILGTILKIYIDYGIQVLLSEGPENTADIIYHIAEREQAGKQHEPRLVGRKRAYTDYQWQVLILGSIPGIGPKLARNLLAHFRTIKNLSNASVAEMVKIEKIGKKKAERVHSILNTDALKGADVAE